MGDFRAITNTVLGALMAAGSLPSVADLEETIAWGEAHGHGDDVLDMLNASLKLRKAYDRRVGEVAP